MCKFHLDHRQLFFQLYGQYYIYYLEYVYPSDYICVHTDNISAFQNKFSKYIFEHTENNIINNNILYGINKKITMKLFNDKKY